MVIILVIISLSVLILVHELGHFLAAKFLGLRVEEFGFGFPPRLFSKKIGETVYSVNLLPLGGFVKLYGETDEMDMIRGAGHHNQLLEPERSFAAQKAWRKAVIVLAGILMNFLLGWLIVSAVFMIGAPKALIITNVISDSPAAAAGLRVGDQILGFSQSQEFIDFVQQHRGREINLDIRRNSENISVKAVPRLEVKNGEGALGVVFSEAGTERQSFLKSLGDGFLMSLAIIFSIFKSLAAVLMNLFTQGKLLENFVGPIGIFGVASQAASVGLVYLLQLIGLISLNLFALNILPFPALDGGRLLFVIIEKIKGAPLSPTLERSVNAIGFIILLILMIAISVRDVVRMF